MIKFLKKYWTHIMGLLVFMPVIFLMIFDSVLGNEFNLISISLLILEFIGVIGVWVAIIYYIVYVVKNKELKNRGLKTVLIYLFNLYYIPCFKLKYVDKDENYKIKNIIYVVFSIILTIVMFFSMFRFSYGDISSDTYKTYISDDKVVEFRIPSNYEKINIGEYDLYFSKGIKVNMGVFLYDDYRYSDLDILNYQEDWLLDARENLELVNDTSINEDGKEINTLVYESNSDVYTLATISFDEKDDYVVYVILISEVDYYEKVKDELENILVNIDLNGNM